MEQVQPRELATGARVAEALVYAVGVAGVLAGALLFQQDEIGFAIVALALTFVAGVALRLAAWMARALATLLIRTDRIQDDLNHLSGKGGHDSDWHMP